MNRIYKSPEGERLVRERYLAFLKHWPVAHQPFRIPTSQGETFNQLAETVSGKNLARQVRLEPMHLRLTSQLCSTCKAFDIKK
jgi:hypothetical protein